jgi:peptidoglycan/LPS O-acetylase OafA/YrhL
LFSFIDDTGEFAGARMIEKLKKNQNIEVMRGIAVLIVVLYHYTTRLPPEALNASAPAMVITNLGKLGVYIFFVLSGYLIAQSIEKSASLADFYAKRIARIWPLFAFASVFVFICMHIWSPPVVYTGLDPFYTEKRTVVDLIGSLFFLKDLGFEWVDGAYWSILTELKFYVIIGIFAAVFRGRFIERFAIFAVVVTTIDLILMISEPGHGVDFAQSGDLVILSKILHGGLISIYLPLFALGLLLHRGHMDAMFCAIALLAIISAIIGVAEDHKFNVQADVTFLLILGLILIADQFCFGSRVFLWLGKYSYSIYLFHQMLGLTIIKYVTPAIGLDAAVYVALAAICLIAWAASRLVEWRFRGLMMALLGWAFGLLGLNRVKVGTRDDGVRILPLADAKA